MEIELINIFIKKLSLKSIEPLEFLDKKIIFDTKISPLGIRSRKLFENKYEVLSDCNVNIYNDNKEILLLLSIELLGIFKIYPQSTSLKELLYVDCANFLYPYLRSEIMSIISKFGITSINLPYINFKDQYDKMYRNN